MIGDFASGNSPSTTCKSVRHTPHACTRTRISPAPGAGSGTFARSRGVCGARRIIARMVSSPEIDEATLFLRLRPAAQRAERLLHVLGRVQAHVAENDGAAGRDDRSEEHTSELQSHSA